jgi:hypothetical protein
VYNTTRDKSIFTCWCNVCSRPDIMYVLDVNLRVILRKNKYVPLVVNSIIDPVSTSLFFFFFCFAVASQNLLYTSYRMISLLNHLESRMKCEPIDGFGVGRSTLYRRQICKSKVHIEIVDICVKRERPFSAPDSSTRRCSIYWWIERIGATLNELNALGSTLIARRQMARRMLFNGNPSSLHACGSLYTLAAGLYIHAQRIALKSHK